MSKGFTSATIIGNLGKDPEVRSTTTGKKIASFSLAVEDGYGDKLHTDWWDIIAWGDLAEFAEKYLKKGKTVSVIGKLQVDSWDDKQTGQKKSKTKINAKDISFFDSGSGSSGSRDTTTTPARREPAPAERRASSEPIDDDLPF